MTEYHGTDCYLIENLFFGGKTTHEGEQSRGFTNVWDPLYVTFQTLLPPAPNASITSKRLPK